MPAREPLAFLSSDAGGTWNWNVGTLSMLDDRRQSQAGARAAHVRLRFSLWASLFFFGSRGAIFKSVARPTAGVDAILPTPRNRLLLPVRATRTLEGPQSPLAPYNLGKGGIINNNDSKLSLLQQQSSPYFDPTHTRTGWIGQPPILDRLEVVTDNGDVDTLGQATP